MPEPIKRHEALQDLSRDHHEGLLVCFKIRQGLKAKIEPQRIMKYLRHFYQQHLVEHFKQEEEILFPLIGNSHPMVQTALQQHSELRNLLGSDEASEEHLLKIEALLKKHIRFEERQLFNKIQDEAGDQTLKDLHQKLHPGTSNKGDQWNDRFWEN